MDNHANFITCRHQTFHLGRGVTWLSAQRQSTCKCTLPTGDTNFDLKSGVFVPIAGILELVNRTLVNGVPLLTWRRKRGRWKEKKREWREAGKKKRGVKDRLKVCSTEQKRPESTVTDWVTEYCCISMLTISQQILSSFFHLQHVVYWRKFLLKIHSLF